MICDADSRFGRSQKLTIVKRTVLENDKLEDEARGINFGKITSKWFIAYENLTDSNCQPAE